MEQLDLACWRQRNSLFLVGTTTNEPTNSQTIELYDGLLLARLASVTLPAFDNHSYR
jgi:hypothetical protein